MRDLKFILLGVFFDFRKSGFFLFFKLREQKLAFLVENSEGKVKDFKNSLKKTRFFLHLFVYFLKLTADVIEELFYEIRVNVLARVEFLFFLKDFF